MVIGVEFFWGASCHASRIAKPCVLCVDVDIRQDAPPPTVLMKLRTEKDVIITEDSSDVQGWYVSFEKMVWTPTWWSA